MPSVHVIHGDSLVELPRLAAAGRVKNIKHRKPDQPLFAAADPADERFAEAFREPEMGE